MDGKLVFLNEAEAVADLEAATEENASKNRPKKRKGKREEDLSGLPVVTIGHKMSDEELCKEFGAHGWKQLPEIYKRYRFTPLKWKWRSIM